MKSTEIVFIILFILISGTIKGQKDTVLYFPDRGEYEIRYWANVSGRDTFLTVIFIPSNKISPAIHSKVSKNKVNDLFEYNYSIKNESQSKQAIEFFLLEINKSVPYINSTTNKWFWGIDERLNGGCSWFDTTFLEPSHMQNGFKIQSKNLPGVGRSYFQGQLPFYTFSEEETTDFLDNVLDSLSTIPTNSVLKKTIVPVYLSEVISNNDFLDTLKSYIHQAYSLRWIVSKKDDDKEKHDKEKEKGSELVKELIKYLDKAREQLAKNKIKEAKKQLEEFVEKVEENYHENDDDEKKEKPEHGYLTSEAYALLKYNAEYLIGKLK